MVKIPAKICYILLCHKDPDSVIEQIDYLLESGGYVVVHIDKNTHPLIHRKIHGRFEADGRVRFAKSIRGGWGDWSLVNATLRTIDLALEFSDATNFYYLSGDCVPIRSHEDLKNDLEKNKLDIIEAADFYNSGWIQTGPHLERIQFYHFINERKHKKLFYLSYKIQRLLGVKRNVPEGLNLCIGSQWWCLRRRTLERIRVYLGARPDIIKFFKWSWIPDEIFFQSLVATLVLPNERRNRPPTFLRFSDYGLPTVFYNDHYSFLTSQEEYFARKISPNAVRLKQRLINRFRGESDGQPTVDSGRTTVGFHAYAGRNGYRFGRSFWRETEVMPEGSTIYVIVSKKWHIGKEYTEQLSKVMGVRDLGYIFDDDELHGTPKMGGFELGRQKRLESPVAFLRTIMEVYNLQEVILGVDSLRHPELKQIANGENNVRIVEIENQFSSEYLDGHAERAGLMVQRTNKLQQTALHRTILEMFNAESRAIKKLKFKKYGHMLERQTPIERAEVLGETFDADPVQFESITRSIKIDD